jgi:hypothetical protein
MEVLSMSLKKSNGPLLYIHQPFARTPATKMQDVYTSKQELEELEEEKPIEDEGKKKISLAKKEVIQESVSKETPGSENPQTTYAKTIQKRHHSSFNRVKPFKEMNVTERLDYLRNYPTVLPPARCMFITDEKNYQGFLSEYDGQEVTIRLQDQSTTTVPIHALKGVNLMGIKK